MDKLSLPHQSVELLKALGKTKVYLRSWVGKGFDDVPKLGYKDEYGNPTPGRAYKVSEYVNGSRKFDWDIEDPRWIQEATRQNSAQIKPAKSYPYQYGGFCPYFVVNSGGHKQAEITECHALFCEFDAPITKEEALSKLEAFPLRFSALVESRNGYHAYWFLKTATSPSLWRNFQWRLIEQFDSDAGIEDPSRVMRLPGFDHLQAGADPFPVELLSCDGDVRYSLEDFDKTLPPIPDWRLKLSNLPEGRREFDDSTGHLLDLRDFAHNLTGYRPRARREWDTCKCPVHNGTSKNSLHINSQTGAYKCWNGCDPKDIYAEVCRLAGVDPKRKSSLLNSTTQQINKKVNSTKPLQGNGSSDFVEDVELLNGEIGQQLQEIQSWATERIDLQGILPKGLATALHHKAEALPTSVEFLLQPFVAVTAGLIGTSRIQIKKGWTEPAVIWTGLIAEPGSLKSPSQSVIHKPLVGLQIDAEAVYQWRMENYRSQSDTWEKGKPGDRGEKPKEPHRRHYYLSDFTMEALIEKHATEENRAGLTVVCDELSGLFLGLNQHKSGGKGNDRPRLLSLWNGGDVKKDTRGKDGEIFLPETAVSMTGSIQNRVLSKLMSDPDDPDGLWGRFLWSAPPYIPDVWSDLEVDIYDLLKGLYANLDRIPKTTFEFSDKARTLFSQYNNWIVDQKGSAPDAIKNVLSKLKGYGARLALWLHCIEWAFNNSTTEISPVIGTETTAKALKLAHYYLRQAKLLHSQHDNPEIPEPLSKIIGLSKSCPIITPRILQQKKWAKTADEGREFLRKLADLGIGKITGEGNKIQWESTQQFNNSTIQPQHHTQQGVKAVERESTKVDQQFNKIMDPSPPPQSDPLPDAGLSDPIESVECRTMVSTKPDPGGGSDPVPAFNSDEWEEF